MRRDASLRKVPLISLIKVRRVVIGLFNQRTTVAAVFAITFVFCVGCGGAAAGTTGASVSPSSVSFGSQTINTSNTASITISSGRKTQVQNVSINGSTAFKVTNWTGKTTLQPGSSLQLNVQFTPNAAGSYSASLTIATNGNSILVPLSGTGSSTSGTPSPISIAVSPQTASLKVNQSAQFADTVSGTTNTAVTWLVNGVQGGSSTVGTVTSAGLYTAPSSPPAGGSASVTVRSNADPTKSASASVAITAPPPPVSVSISPTSVGVQVSQSQQFTATVSGTTNTSVAWLVNGVPAGYSAAGTITANGLYTAPSTVPSGSTVTVAAQSVADSTKSASATVSIAAAPSNVSVSVTPTSATVSAGASQQFSATVSGTTNTSVNWSVNGLAGGNATYGAISQTGLYTAPPCPSVSGVTVTATSAYNSTSTANSSVTLTGTSSSSTRYVAPGGSDSNDGSACHPWATIGHAASAVSAGSTVIVEDGTYPENVVITKGGTSESNRVTFRSQNKWGAHIAGVNGTSSSLTNTITVSASYVTIQDFEITGWDYTGYGIKEQNPANHINVIGNNIHSMGKGASACVRGGGIGAVNYTLINDNQIWDISIYPRGRLACNYQHGIYVLGGDGGTITNNQIYEIWEGIGIQFDGARYNNWTVANNTIFNVAYASGGDGGAMYFNCDGSSSLGAGTCDNNVWRNNIFANSYRYCWFVTSMNGGTLGANNVYDHNLTYNCGNSHLQTGTVTNQVTSDPQFVNYTGDENGDYHLQSASPARNGGSNTNCPATDYDGISRPQENTCDIGAYEFHF